MQTRRALQILAYNVAVYLGFCLAYSLLGFNDTHFVRPEADQKGGSSRLGQVMYFAWVTHTTIGYGDFLPRTPAARTLMAAHAAFVWAQVLIFTS